MPGFTPYATHAAHAVPFGKNVDFFMDDMITPNDSIDRVADRPHIGDLYVFLGSIKKIQ